jgi:hypothetical protein
VDARRRARPVADGDVGADRDLADQARASADPVTWFVVGNLLFARDREDSFDLHRRAWEALPDEPAVALEWAIELHRADRCAEAVPRYEQYLAAQPQPGPIWWALAHCRLVTGDLDGAVDAWRRAPPEQAQEGAEDLFGELYAPYEPWGARAERLTRARGGDSGAWFDVLALDAAFRRDLWNSPPMPELIERDRAEARRSLPPDDAAQLTGAVALWSGEPAPELLRTWRRRLPARHDVAEAVLVAEIDASSAEAVLRRQRRDLRRRADAGDLAALDLLGALVAQAAPEELAALDAEGCAAGLRGSCVSALAGDAPPDLAALQRRFPNDARFSGFALERALATRDPTADELVAYLVDAPRWMPTSAPWSGALATLGRVRAGAAVVPEARTLLATMLRQELSRPDPSCAPWDAPELLAAPVCAVSP